MYPFNVNWCKVDKQLLHITIVTTYLILAAFTALKTCKNLAFYSMNPRIPFLKTAGLEMPCLTGTGYNDEFKILFYWRKWK